MADWVYRKYDENGKVLRCPLNDYDGSVTGHIVFGVKAWFDENPEERIRLGWIKHILHSENEIEYNRQTQYVIRSLKRVDDYTIEDVLRVLDKTEDMLLLEELMEGVNIDGYNQIGSMTFYGPEGDELNLEEVL